MDREIWSLITALVVLAALMGVIVFLVINMVLGDKGTVCQRASVQVAQQLHCQ